MVAVLALQAVAGEISAEVVQVMAWELAAGFLLVMVQGLGSWAKWGWLPMA
jgi:hypothetical protein